MSHKYIEIKEGAFLISDAHYCAFRPQLLDFFKAIQEQKLLPTQIILMGDIFDTLFGGVKKTYIQNKELVELINDISQKIELIYLEGNHDFNLKNIFKYSKVFSIKQQPILAKLNNKKIYLAHGDFKATKVYKMYTFIVRAKITLYVLNFLNSILNDLILKKLNNYLSKKKDCTKIDNFKDIIESRLENKYQCDYFLEGHFHQNKFMKFDSFNYFNLAAFACNQRYFIVKSSNEELLVEKIFSKG